MPSLLYVSTVPYTLRQFYFPFARHFRRKGWRVDAAGSQMGAQDDFRSEFDHQYHVPWSRSPARLTNILSAPRAIKDLVCREDYDIVHVSSPTASFVTRYALRGIRRRGRPKVIYTAHGFHFHPLGNFATNAVYGYLEKTAGKWTDYLVVINRVDFNAALSRRFLDPRGIKYMPGIGVDTKALDPARFPEEKIASVKREIGVSDGAPVFSIVAEFNPGKRHADAINALAVTNAGVMPFLVLVGEGPLLGQMRQLAARLGIADRVRFLGYRADAPDIIRCSDAVLLPSIREGLPRCVMEALSLGVPVIGCRVRGTEELLDDGCGIICEPGDVAGLAAAMQWVIRHPEEAREMGRKGRAKMQGPYEISNIIRLHEELYEEALRT